MSDKNKIFAAPPAPKSNKTKRPSTVSVTASSSRTKVSTSVMKDKNIVSRPTTNKNTTLRGEADVTLKQEGYIPDFDAEYRQIAYGKFLRAMLQDCMVDEKIEREETQIDIQMAQLADRFQKTMDQLDKTNRRLKDISFVVEQERLIDLKSNDSARVYEMTDKSNANEILKDLSATEQACLDKLDTKNVDFGYNKESGHKQLLDAVNEAIEGLEEIKKHSNLDIEKFKEYEKSQRSLDELDKDRFDLESMKSEFEQKFPKFSEKLIKEASEKIIQMIQNDDDNDSDDD